MNWRWYQNSYDTEPIDAATGVAHENYVSHHQGPHYFGYPANNLAERSNFKGEGDFFSNMSNHALPSNGGVNKLRSRVLPEPLAAFPIMACLRHERRPIVRHPPGQRAVTSLLFLSHKIASHECLVAGFPLVGGFDFKSNDRVQS